MHKYIINFLFYFLKVFIMFLNTQRLPMVALKNFNSTISPVSSVSPTIGVIKKFDKDLHNETDDRGKNATLNMLSVILSGTDYYAIENPDKYGIDILVLNSKNLVVSGIEVEVRFKNWDRDTGFPFSTVNCLMRKDHYWGENSSVPQKIPFEVHPIVSFLYCQWNSLCTRCVIVLPEEIKKVNPIVNKNRYVPNGEKVKQVSIDKCIQINTSSLKTNQFIKTFVRSYVNETV